MTPTNRLEVLKSRREPEPRISIRIAGSQRRVEIPAARLVAQYALDSRRTLAVLDEDVPFEEQLHLVLLIRDRIADHIEIGAPYSTGEFREIALEDEAIAFAFDGDDPWRLEALPTPRRMFGGLPAGARRRGGFLKPRYMQLSRGGLG